MFYVISFAELSDFCYRDLVGMNHQHVNRLLIVGAFLILLVASVIVEEDKSALESSGMLQERFNQFVGRATPIAESGFAETVQDIPLVGGFLSVLIDAISQISIIGSIETLYFTFQLLVWLITASIVGYLCGKSIRGRGFGIIGNCIIGVAGTTIGTMILQIAGLKSIAYFPLIGKIITGFIGAIIFVHILRLVDHNFSRY